MRLCSLPVAFGAVAIVAMALSHANGQSSRRPANLHQSVSEHYEQGHMVSWVVLSKSYVELDENKLRARLDEAFPGAFLPPRDQGSFVVEGPVAGAQFLIQSRVPGVNGVFMLNSVPGPYTRFSNFDKFIQDRTMKRQARAQRAWLSIDLMAKHSGATESEAYRFIGRALAKLAPEDAAFLVHPTRRIIVPFDEARRRLERGEQIP